MTRFRTAFRAALLSVAALLPAAWAEAQLVETVKEYTITIEPGGDACEVLSTVGERCGPELDIVYVGHGVSGRKLFATQAPLASSSWNYGSSSYNKFVGRMSGIDGAGNSQVLASANAWTYSSQKDHLAAQACENLTQGGYDDWYLPASGRRTTKEKDKNTIEATFETLMRLAADMEAEAQSYVALGLTADQKPIFDPLFRDDLTRE